MTRCQRKLEAVQLQGLPAQQVLANAVARLPIARTCECAKALATAIITRPESVSVYTRAKLLAIVGKYL